jgi:ankyrin repeat protein
VAATEPSGGAILLAFTRVDGDMSGVELLQAAGRGDVAWLTRLLDAGCDANTVHPITGASALYNACFCSAVDAVRLLLSRGADPNKRLTYRSPRRWSGREGPGGSEGGQC